ncbi:hypothetical protein ABR35_20610 [Enterobacter cloacae subsp. cloacae]|nr:hypothetical protein ABR35_20610 [Enterobacter cloacae subsp. cloacae]
MFFDIITVNVFRVVGAPTHGTDHKVPFGFKNSFYFSQAALPGFSNKTMQTTTINNQIKL